MEGDVITLQDLFLFDYGAGSTRPAESLGTSSRPGCGRSSSTSSPTGGIRSDPTIFAFEKFGR